MNTPTPEQIDAALAVVACGAIGSAGRILAAAFFAAREDSHRYRAIKDGGWTVLTMANFDKTGKQQPGVRYEVCAKTDHRATNLDDAIDAAIAAEKKGLQ